MSPGGGTESLDAGLYAWKLVEAAELIRSTYNGWAAQDIQKFKDMLVYPGYSTTSVPASVNNDNGTFYWRIYRGDPGRHGNQDLIAWRAMITMGVFMDNRIMYDRALRYFKGLPHRSDDLPYPPGPSPSGSLLDSTPYFDEYRYAGPPAVNPTPDWGYNGVLEHYIWENGQNQESSRDQQHAFFGVGTAMGIAEVAWNQSDPVWNSLDTRLLKGVEFISQYNTSYIQSFPDQPAPWEPDNFIQQTDRTGRWFSKQIKPYFDKDYTRVSRGDFPGKRPVYEQAVAHFMVRMGFDMEALWSLRGREVAIEQAGYETTGFSLDHPGWGAITFRRPALCAGDPISGFINEIPQFSIPVIPATIEAENYDYFPDSGEGHTYHDLTAGNTGGAYRSDSDVDIKAVGVENHVLTDLDSGEWITYTIHVPEAGNYDIYVRYSAANGDGQIGFAFGGINVTGNVDLPATATADELTSVTVAKAIRLEAGVQAMRISVMGQSDAFELDSITIQRFHTAARGDVTRLYN